MPGTEIGDSTPSPVQNDTPVRQVKVDSKVDSTPRTSKSDRAVYWGTGRRKNAIARVRLVPGSGKMIVNKREGDHYFNYNPTYLVAAKAPLETLGLENEYDILVNAHGGGLTGQADAVKLGVARALCELDPGNRKPLKSEGYLTRDPRAKERRKYGLKKARKAPQYSKR